MKQSDRKMFFSVGTFDTLGFVDIKKFYKVYDAFNFAISIESSNVKPCIRERQWNDTKMTVIENIYFVKNKSIYLTVEPTTPIYSFDKNYIWVNTLRYNITEFCNKVIDIYTEKNLSCPYSTEFFYSASHIKMLEMAKKLQSDPIVKKFYEDIDSELYDVELALSSASVKINNVNGQLLQLKIKDIKPFIQEFKRRAKMLLTLNAYGGLSELNLYLDNLLTPLIDVAGKN